MSRWSKWRKILLVVAAVLAVAGIGGAVTAVLTYHEATKIDRSNPKVVLDEYLRAIMVEKDPVGVELYSCEDGGQLNAIRNFRNELDQREKDFSVEIEVSWGAIDLVGESQTQLATTDLVIIARKQGAVESRSRERWQFGLSDQDGWRVCSSAKSPLPAPSPSSVS
ncbi:hypothetical protein CS0771_10680 [Catellatospora sp. IY07-71]|nr:hypothetical protein CS0771_10680 [Catellatospora sp. IY07-71]